MNLCSILPRVLMSVLLASLPAGLAAAEDEDSTLGATRSPGEVKPVLEVVSAVGEPRTIPDDGDPATLSTDDRIPLETMIETDADSRLAVSVARSPEIPPNRTDLLVIGPETRLRLQAPPGDEEADQEADEDQDDQRAQSSNRPERVEAVLEAGSLRVVVRYPGNFASLRLRVAGHAVSLRNADGIVDFDPDEQTATFLIRKGQALIEFGERRIRVTEGLMRRIEGDHVLGARSYSEQRWRDAIERTSVPNINAAPTPPPADEASRGSAASATPADAKREAGEPSSVTLADTRRGGEEPTSAPPADAEEPAELVLVRVTTTMGDITLGLDEARAPITVKNFLAYVDRDFYDGTLIHRIIPPRKDARGGIAIIQGGGLNTDWERKPTDEPIENEWENGLRNVRGSIAMARRGSPDSATSQFFINVSDNPALDRALPAYGNAAYCVFGRVVEGMDVVDRIANVPTGRVKGRSNAPLEPVVIEKVERIDGKPPAE